jgi:UDP-3-O-acyl N-acetylglucosamine deacetylase
LHRIAYRYQRTIERAVEVRGFGYLTGADVRLRFCPAPEHTGVVFIRTDLPGSPSLAARVANVTGTNRRTTLGRPPVLVELVEHVLASLAGMKIDNCFIELNAPEPPGLDGSAQGFVTALKQAGLRLQNARRAIWTVNEPVSVSEGGGRLTLHPFPDTRLRVTYLLDYGPQSPIVLQRHTEDAVPEGFLNGLAMCRTFLLDSEAEALRKQGLGAKTSMGDLLVFGPRGPIDNELRFGNEPARHKGLDIVGDLSLLGHDLVGHVVGYRSGHSHNVRLVRRLLAEIEQAQPTVARLAA